MSTTKHRTKFIRPSAGFSVTILARIRNVPGSLSQLVKYLASRKASLTKVELKTGDFNYVIREITINCRSEAHSREIIEGIKNIEPVELLNWRDDTFEVHKGGKIEVLPLGSMDTPDELSRIYTPGVARVCSHIHEHPEDVFDYTIKGNTVAVVTDGSAVLGLGNIGPEAALPVMEGKAALFKHFAGINAFPICLDTQDAEEIIATVKHIAPGFGGINLEDISAPRCFEVEERLRKELDIPVFHDDQHGTAAVVLAGLINALRIVGKDLSEIKVVVNGYGAGGVACTKMLLAAGVEHIVPCDSVGIVYRGRKERMNPIKEQLLELTNPDNIKGKVRDALKGADVFVGVSQPNVLNRKDIEGMAKDPIVFALANPVPEIMPEELEGLARIIATGRSDYANQVNNVLCFPGLFKGALECRASDITDGMKIAAAQAIADSVDERELHENHIIPSIFSADVFSNVASAVKAAAVAEGVCRK